MLSPYFFETGNPAPAPLGTWRRTPMAAESVAVEGRRRRRRPFNGLWSGTTRVGRYQKEHSPTHTHPDHRASFIIFLHLQRSMASSLFNLRAWQSSRTTSFQVFFGLPLGLGPSTSCSIHFFTQSSSSFRNTWPYQRSLFCCNTNAMSSTPSLSGVTWQVISAAAYFVESNFFSYVKWDCHWRTAVSR